MIPNRNYPVLRLLKKSLKYTACRRSDSLRPYILWGRLLAGIQEGMLLRAAWITKGAEAEPELLRLQDFSLVA
jgi:hypothetical protein